MKKLLEEKKWPLIKLIEIVGYIKGKKPFNMVDEEKENYLPYLSTEYLRNNGETKYVKISKDIISVNEGEIILLWDGSNAGEFFEGKKGILSSTMVKFSIKKEIDKKYLFYLLKTKERYLQGQTKGTGIPHVDKNVLINLDVSLPPLFEQKHIAEILNTIDKKLDSQKLRKEKLEKVKKGLMNELLTGKKRVNVEKVLGETNE